MSAYALVCEGAAGEAVAVTVPRCRFVSDEERKSDRERWMDDEDGVDTAVRRQTDPQLKQSAQTGAAATYRVLRDTLLVARRAGMSEPQKYWVVYSFSPDIGPLTGASAGLLFALKFAEELAQQAGRDPLECSYAATGIVDPATGRLRAVDYLEQKLEAALRTLQPGDKLFYPPPDTAPTAAWRRLTRKARRQGIHLCPVRTVRTALAVLLGDLVPSPIEVSILRPGPGSVCRYGEPIAFHGAATDADDGPLPGGSFVWQSHRDGELGTGNPLRTVGLSLGLQTITLVVTNTRGLSAAATVTLRVQRRGCRDLLVAVCSGLLAVLTFEYPGPQVVTTLQQQVAALQQHVTQLQAQVEQLLQRPGAAFESPPRRVELPRGTTAVLRHTATEGSVGEPPPALPASQPAVRAGVEQALKEIGAQREGSRGAAPRVGTGAPPLDRQLDEGEILELVHILGETHEMHVHGKAMRWLQSNVHQPASLPWHPQILKAICHHVKGGGLQEAALALLQKLRTPPMARWQCLFEALQMVDERALYKIIPILVRFTPPEQRERTGALILDRFLYQTDEDSYDGYVVKALADLDYRQAIPTLQELFRRQYHHKIVPAAELLAHWEDKDAIPLLRQYIDATHKQSTSDTPLRVLQSLYQLEGSACADYIAQILLTSSVRIQRQMGGLLEEFKHEPQVIVALRELVKTTKDAEIRKSLGEFLASQEQDR